MYEIILNQVIMYEISKTTTTFVPIVKYLIFACFLDRKNRFDRNICALNHRSCYIYQHYPTIHRSRSGYSGNCDSPSKDGNARFSTVPLKPFTVLGFL